MLSVHDHVISLLENWKHILHTNSYRSDCGIQHPSQFVHTVVLGHKQVLDH